MKISDKTLFLFTKKFPYGHQETYLFNELPFLVKTFSKVIIVPYDEFEYDEEGNRITGMAHVEIIKINHTTVSVGLIDKLRRELFVWHILLFELFKGREPLNHFKYFKRNSSQIRHSFLCARQLCNHISKYSIKGFVLYNYWLHGGVIISNIVNALLHKTNDNVVSRAHAYDVYHKDWYSIYPQSAYLFLGFETWKIYHTKKIAVISQHGFNHFKRLFPNKMSKFSVSRLGVLEHEVKTMRKDEDTLVWITCSNIDDNKRIYLLPQLISLMKRRIRWHHFGKENSKMDKERLENEIKKFNVTENCKLEGLKPNSEIIQFYQTNTIDLVLNLSQIEGIPVSLMEAASFGVPMVATNTVGNPEIVNNDNGFLIEVDFNIKDLAKQLNGFFENPELIARKRKASRDTFKEKYSAAINYPEFIDSVLLVN